MSLKGALTHHLVVTSSVSLVSAKLRKLIHFTVPPLPKKSMTFWGPLVWCSALSEGADDIYFKTNCRYVLFAL